MLTKEQLVAPLARLRTNEVVITTMGVVRAWGAVSDNDLDFAHADSAMGHAADFALGIALAQPQRKVICLNGDGSMLMSLGTLVTIVQSGARNLMLFVIENATYEITGNQPVPGAGVVDFVAMARAAGFAQAFSFSDATAYAQALPQLLRFDAPVFIAAKVQPGHEKPYARTGGEGARYLQVSLAESARQLGAALAAASSGSR